MNTYSLAPVIFKPSRNTNISHSLIDNIFISNQRSFISSLLTVDVSDHFPNFIIYDNYFQNTDQWSQVRCRCVNVTPLNHLFVKFSSRDFSSILQSDDVNYAIEYIDNALNDDFNECCPIKCKQISYKDQTKPWITPAIKHNIKKREIMCRLFKLNHISRISYSSFRNSVTTQIRQSKKQYFEKLFRDNCNSAKQTWQIINRIIKPNQNSKKPISCLEANGSYTEDEFEMAELLNSHFSTIAGNLVSSLGPSNYSYRRYLGASPYLNSFFFLSNIWI